MTYVIRKFVYMITSLFIVVTATFGLMKAIPGDPFAEEQAISHEIVTSLREHYHLNDPWYVQYGHYLKSICTFDLGPSFKYKARTVNEIIASGFPVSATLGAEALAIAIVMGLTLGTIAALNANRWPDYAAMVVALIGLSIPSFLLAALLQYFFAIKLSILPVARWGSFAQSILPALSLSALPTAFIARMTRASMLEVLRNDYLKTARAKGLSMKSVVIKHALRNAMLPVITYIGPLSANILIGSFVIEKIYGIPGLGQWFVNSISNRDYTLIMGMTVFYAVILLLAVFVVDLIYMMLDPRIRLKRTEQEYA